MLEMGARHTRLPDDSIPISYLNMLQDKMVVRYEFNSLVRVFEPGKEAWINWTENLPLEGSVWYTDGTGIYSSKELTEDQRSTGNTCNRILRT